MAYFPKRSLERNGLAPEHDLTANPREYFFRLMNPEQFPEVFAQARIIADYFLLEAEDYMTEDQPGTEWPQHFTFFEYSPSNFTKKMYDIYDYLLDMRYLSWLKAGEPETWYTKSKARLLSFILHGAPFHLTDGGWLRGTLPVGPINEVTNSLASIWADELGNGKFEENHCNVYHDILASHGYSIPPVDSKEFSQMQLLREEAFIQSVFHLAISLHARSYYAEVLGMTLFLEWTSPSYHQAKIKLWERHNINPTFSKLHTAIDNVSNGHGKLALDAILSYLDSVEKSQGKTAAKEAWRRVWRGYMAYGISASFNEVQEHLWEHLKQEPDPARDVVAVFEAKAALVDQHTDCARVDVDGKPFSEWLRDPVAFVTHLQSSPLVKRGDAKNSRLMSTLLVPTVFSHDDVNTIVTWINCLPRDLLTELSALIKKKAVAGKYAHKSLMVTGSDGQTRPFNELWSEPREMMWALIHNGYVTVPPDQLARGDVESCRLIQSITGYGPMAGKFSREDVNLFRDWIRQGCPLPASPSSA